MQVIRPTTTEADFTAAYVAARKTYRTAWAFADQDVAAIRAQKIADLAERAGFVLDTITLDEQARVS